MSLRDQLGAVRAELARRDRRDAEQRARELALDAQARAQREQFARAVGPVTRLADAGRASRAPTPPAPEPRQRQADEARALASSLSDELDTTTLMDTDAGLAWLRPGIGGDVLARLRRGHWSIQRQLDLHGRTRDVARDALADFLRRAARDGLRCVRVIHGKGHGSPGREPVLKAKVRAWLVQREEVLAFVQARASDGGHGAVIVLLDG
ncbi:MAG TPA: Smr/MutS family protein [Burkholderiaceae bacterium]|nr:Smr/MutS family protein [Burkholderiaceae bacterium]